MVRADAVRAVVQHCRSVEQPVVLLSGPYGASFTWVIRDAEHRLGTAFEICGIDLLPGQPLRRRLSILDAPGISDPRQAAAALQERARAFERPGSTGPHLVIRGVELLDETSTEVLRHLLRGRSVGLVLTTTAESLLPAFFTTAMHRQRARKVELSGLARAEGAQLLHDVLGAEPTTAFAEYMRSVSGGAPRELRTIARAGVEDGWIGSVGRFSCATRRPPWVDQRLAEDTCFELDTYLGRDATDILQHIALQGDVSLDEMTVDDGVRFAVFWFIEAGVLTLRDFTVSLARPSYQRGLVVNLSRPVKTQARSADAVLHRRLTGQRVETQDGLLAARDLLERGLLEQAEAVLHGLGDSDPRVPCLRAEICAAGGKPRGALQLLKGVSAKGPRARQMTALRTFISRVLLGLDEPAQGALGDVPARLEIFDDAAPQQYLKAFGPPEVQRTAGPEGTTEANGPDFDAPTVTYAVAAALDSYGAAIAGDHARARASLQLLDRVPYTRLPVVAVTWVRERAGLARLMSMPAAPIIPAEWTSTEAPERALLCATTDQALQLIEDLMRGVPIAPLRTRMESLWSHFESGLPAGDVNREMLETIDHALGGRRSTDIAGPPGLSNLPLTRTLRDGPTDALELTGRLLHAQQSSLPATLQRARATARNAPGMQGVVLRGLLLRRAHEMSARTLESVLAYAAEVGVPEQLLARARQLVSTPEARAELLDQPIPQYPGWRFCHAGQRRSAPAGAQDLGVDSLLTRRESEIVEHLLLGAAAADVAHDLSISVRTVQTHVRNIYSKLGVGSRTELRARMAVEGVAS